MSYSVKTIPQFERQAKRLVKKYASLKIELLEIAQKLKTEQALGTSIGKNCHKIRISIASKGKGKSGGARIITTFVVKDSIVYLLSVYDKSEKDSISDKELDELLSNIPD